MKKITLALSFFCCTSVFAEQFKFSDDTWKGEDKMKHFLLSSAFGVIGSHLAKDTKHPVVYGAIVGAIPGLAKEIYDGHRKGGTGFSGKDMAYNVLGSLVGASIGNYTIGYYRNSKGDKGVGVRYQTQF